MAGPEDIDPAKPHAFLSYTRFDDKFLNGGISALREALEQAVQARTGKPFNIFQDVDDIKPGDAWQKKLDRAIQAAQLFIPILTPSFFESDFCRGEAQAFLDYETRAGRDDLVLPIYLIDTPKLDDADQRVADEIASRLHERQYDDWRLLRFKLQHHDTLPRIDELAGAIAHAAAKNGQAAAPPPEPRPSEDVMDRLVALEGRLEERDREVAAERFNRVRLESELAEQRAKVRQLADAPSAFEGQVEEARKHETAPRDEIDRLKEELTARDSASAKAALEEKAKHDKVERQAPGIRRSFYLGSAALALLFGAGGWMAGQGGSSSSDLDLLRLQNQELIEQLDARTVQLDEAHTVVSELQASANEAQDSDDKVATLTEQVKALTTRLAVSERVVAAMENELQAARQDLTQAQSAREEGEIAKSNQSYEPLSTFRDCADCPEMVVIPAGSFEMGSPDDEEGRRDREGPQHTVTIEASLVLGKFEVTRGEFSRFVSATGHQAKGCRYFDGEAWKIDPDRDWRDPVYEQTDAHPVTCVSWGDAQAYVDWLSKETGKTYRLPSEAEWEYAARAGTTTRYFWGDGQESACTSANGHDETSKTQSGFGWTAFPCDDGYTKTAPVGSFRANAFGLHDVTGSLWEWVEDSWHDNYDRAPTDGSVRDVGDNFYKVIRGGSWFSRPELLRSAFRGWLQPSFRNYDVGFRVARTLTP